MLVGVGAAAALAVAGCAGDDGDDEVSGDDGGAENERGSAPGGDGPEAEVIAYGDEGELQRGALSLPTGGSLGPVPVVVLVHGGFWRAGYDRSLMARLAASVTAEGWAAWNIDYRPIGEGGGWPTTFTDLAAAVDHLATVADEHGLDLDRVAVVGHSAGGTLALWSAAREGLPAETPGAGPEVRPIAVVSQAGVTNLAAGAIEGLGQGAVVDLMGGQPPARTATRTSTPRPSSASRSARPHTSCWSTASTTPSFPLHNLRPTSTGRARPVTSRRSSLWPTPITSR